jgi:hypothetical protein
LFGQHVDARTVSRFRQGDSLLDITRSQRGEGTAMRRESPIATVHGIVMAGWITGGTRAQTIGLPSIDLPNPYNEEATSFGQLPGGA